MSEDIRDTDKQNLSHKKPKTKNFKKRTARLKEDEQLDHRLKALWNIDHDVISEPFERYQADLDASQLVDFLKDSQTATQLLFKEQDGMQGKLRAEVYFDDQTMISQYYPDKNLIALNPDRPLAELACVLIKELRRAWQAESGTLYNPLKFTPDEAILLNRAQQADALMMSIRVAWELKLLGQNDMWNFMIGAPFADITRTFEIHAQNDFRSLNDGRAGRAAYDKWFEDQRTKIHDKRIIHQMLLEDSTYIEKRAEHLEYLTDQMLFRMGDTPFGSNYMSLKDRPAPSHHDYAEVMDRSNANFLWFVKFERNFQEKENEMLDESLSLSADIIDFAKKAQEMRKN